MLRVGPIHNNKHRCSPNGNRLFISVPRLHGPNVTDTESTTYRFATDTPTRPPLFTRSEQSLVTYRFRREFDSIAASLIATAQADPQLTERADVLSLMLQARYDDGAAMTPSDIADELLTLLAAGHETTATSLAWAIERLRRHPDVLGRLVEEVDAAPQTCCRPAFMRCNVSILH